MMRYTRALCILWIVAAHPVLAQSVLDATVATVNGEYVMKSDVLWNLALDPTVRPEDFWSQPTQDLMLRTLIDQRLLLQEASKLPATTVGDEEVADYIKGLAERFNSDDANRFTRRLALVGLTGPRLETIVRDRLQIEKYVDFRFRSFIVLTEPEVRQYFDTEIKPKLEDQTAAGLDKIFAAQRPKIEQSMTEEKITTAIDTYLEEARSRAEVVIFEPGVGSQGTGTGAGGR
jgi:hypothetical protein